MIYVQEKLRLRPIGPKDYARALPWYEDPDILWFSEHTRKSYDLSTITRMYDYLSSVGTVYFIEVLEEDRWIAIGDVTLSEACMPLVLQPAYWGRGIGKQVILALLDLARQNGFSEIKLSGIYRYNKRSQSLFQSCGFIKTHEDEEKVYMRIPL